MKTFNKVNLNELYTLFNKDANPKQKFSLLLIGEPGTGKTTWVRKSFWRWHEEHTFVDWGTEAQWNPTTLEKRIDLEWGYGRGTLVIDDFGLMPNQHMHYGQSIAPLDRLIECIYRVWRARHERQDLANIVITTNKLPEGLKEKLGERAYGRLAEMLPVATLLDGVDFRNA